MTTELQQRIDNALIEARKLSEDHNPNAAAAWDEVEELFAEVSHQKEPTRIRRESESLPFIKGG